MSIGGTLAQARRDAGLTVTDIASRTRIRPNIIKAIEGDNFSICGGDFYARGDIRAIARALDVESGPLVEEYDAARRPAEPLPAGETSEAAEAFEPLRRVSARRRQGNWILLPGLALLAAGALGGFLLISTSWHAARHGSAPGRHHAAAQPASSLHPSPGHSASSTGHTSTPSPGSSQPAQVLAPVAIAAFGPGGTGSGDSPQLARLALRGNAATPWHSAWYTTPHFGNLQSGTGLLLDMGHTVTITAARIALGYGSGAKLDLRMGGAPTLADLHSVATAAAAGHVVRLSPAPTRGRYVLVWFTKLPPDQAGTFQVSVYDITLFGRH